MVTGATDVVSSCKHCLFPQYAVHILFSKFALCMYKKEVRQMDPDQLLYWDLFGQLGLARISKIIPDDSGNFQICMQTKDTWESQLVRTKRFANMPGFLLYALISTNALCEAWVVVISVIMAG